MPKIEPNRAYQQRSSKRRRTIGDMHKFGDNVVDAIIEDRKRSGRKQYRYTDLQGTDRQEMLRLVRDCAMAAMTTHEIAAHFGVTDATLNLWIAKDPEFAIAMRLPKELADERVVKALYHRAVGYSYMAEDIKITDDGRVHRVPVVKHIPPDVTAGMFWMKNRQAHLWKDKQEVGLEADVYVRNKAEDPRSIAMAVLDVIQQGIYAKLPPTLESEAISVTESVALKPLAEYTDAELEALSPEQRDALFDGVGREDE